jgi:accessory gene regulator protein AgrB
MRFAHIGREALLLESENAITTNNTTQFNTCDYTMTGCITCGLYIYLVFYVYKPTRYQEMQILKKEKEKNRKRKKMNIR